MKLIPYDIKKVHNINGYSKTKNQKVIEEFIASNLDCAKLDGWTQVNAATAAASFKASIKRYGYHGVDVICRKGKVYFIKTI